MKYTYEDIYNEIENEYSLKSSSEVNRGSEVQKKLEAVASELFALSCYGDFVFKQAFVQTATGKYLDRHGEMRDCVRKAGTKAIGKLMFYVSQPAAEDIVIDAATICSSKNDSMIQFETIEAAKILQGETSVEVDAQAVGVGDVYNVEANEITVMVNAPIGVEGVTNQNLFYGGYNEEADSAYRLRIINNYGVMPSAYCKKAIENRICKLEFIADCDIQHAEKAGEMSVVIKKKEEKWDDNSPLELAKAIGLAELVGVVSKIKDAKKKIIDLHIDAAVKPGYDLDKISVAVRDVVENVFKEEEIGASISVSRLFKNILIIDGVESCELSSESIIANMFNCPADAYLTLQNLEVNCFAE